MASDRKTNGTLWLSRSYNFLDRDPEIDRFRTLFQKEKITEANLAVLAGLSNSTVTNMFGGKTVRPQHATFAKMAGAMGYVYGLTRDERPNYEREIPLAIEQRREYRIKKMEERSRVEKRKRR